MNQFIKVIILIQVVVIFLFFLAADVSAQVVINEFSSDTSNDDWIEIYNISSSEVNLLGWAIKDTASSSIREFSGERIPSGTSCIQPASNRLNNDGDRIQLFNGSSQIDCVAYGDGNGSFCGSAADITVPASGQTASRVPDGTGGWVLGSSTKSTILCESLIPAPTATPTNSPTASPTASVSPAPTPTKTPTPKPTTKTTPIALSDDSPPPANSEVLGLRGGLATLSPESQVGGSTTQNSSPFLPWFFIIPGVGLILYTSFRLFKNIKGGENETVI